ncbi:uncharacterized protein PV07_10007 [Cladophialophora immunda]|uniref:B30.2/SPRY domain-containing protein n=1 Tax=Cladophialophora immunda TaxID=569365 RepID=A0A0D2C1A7_9EURO|nr:uncharacterized protein PV07_10007 [Cladophialophora immunda]KIW24280.1 hypothetical protein PV07_10007 [Cladophialophora immunda]OQU97812.1 Ankyrin repeat-containing protein [Cladophialophora immunda]
MSVRNYDQKKDETFEKEAWNAARAVFSGSHDPINFQPFLKDYTTPESCRSSVVQAQKDANSEYNGKLGAILDKVDQFMKVGDLAIKSAPESIGLAWTGIRLCLHSVQDDFATFSLFSGACADILGILISCRVYGGLYASQDHPPEFTELHEKVLSYIKDTYVNIIEFSYQMWKYARSNAGVRVIKGLFRSAQGKFQPKIKAIKDNEAQMNKYASQANQQVSQYYQKQGLDNDQTMMKGLSDQMEMLQALQEEAAKQNQLMEELMKRDELHRKDQRMTAAEITHENWERQKKELPSLDDNLQVLESKLKARKPGTCGWILENTKFQDFVKAEGGNVTWLVGTGGSGKSFLMSVVVEDLKNKAHRHDSLVHYFFISKGSQATMQADQIERHLLAQLYQDAAQSLDVLDKCNKVMAEYIEHQKKSTTKTTSKKAGDGPAGFEQTYTALAKLINKRIYLMIDALDECTDRETQEFIQTIKKLASTHGLKVNIYTSSRDEPDIAAVLENCPRISVEENNSKDIAEHVQAEMAKLPGFTPAEREEACREITQKAGCYFRYVELAMDFMRRPWRRPLSAHLGSLPSGVENIYAQRLNQTNPAYYDLLTHCLTWTILAGEELSVQELIDGYKGSFTDGESDPGNNDDEENVNLELYEDQIRQAGSGFLRVNPDHTVSLVHNTVRDFFLRSDSITNGSTTSEGEPECQCARCQRELIRSRQFVVSEREGHMQIITTILQHLLSPSFQRKYYAKPQDESSGKENDQAQVDGEKPTDVVQNENDAAPEQAVSGDSAPGDGTSGETAPAEATLPEATPAEAQDEPVEINGIQIPNQSPDEQAEGLDGVQQISEHQSEEATTNKPSKVSGEPLTNGVSDDLDLKPAENDGGSDQAQEKGKPPEGKETENTNNAGTADEATDEQSVVDSDENVDLTDQDRARLWDLQSDSDDFPARYEVSRLRWHLTQLEDIYPANERSGEQWSKLRELLERFLDPESEAWRGWIRTLCAAGLAIDSIEMYGDSDVKELHPLVFAACCGLTSLANILLARPNASEFVNLKMPEGMSVLSFAVTYQLTTEKGLDSLFLALLEAGADPNTNNHWDEEYVGSSFHFLLLCRTVTLAQLKIFLDHKAEINTLDETGNNALHFFALGEADLEIGEALVNAGADIHLQNKRGESIMHLLARRDNCRVDIMRYFIDKGAKVDEEDDASERPLLEAAQAGHCEAVRLLLEHEADIEDVNEFDQTALFAAAVAGRTEVVKVLLEKGADPLKRNSLGATPFGMACRHGDAESALLLGKAMVEKGETEHLNWQNASGKTPLMRAASRGISNVIDFILDHVDAQAALTTVSKKGWSPLHYAALRARPEATTTLLKRGADSQCKDVQGKTPLQVCYAKIWTKPDEDREKTISALIDHDQQAAIAEIELLHTLAINDSPELVAKLLEYGANPYATDEHGWNVLQLAEQYDRPEVVEVIKTSRLKTGSRPSKFVGSFSDVVVCSPSGLEIELLERGKTIPETSDMPLCYTTDQAFITEHPIPASAERYYFEMTIADREIKADDPVFVIGITQKPTGSPKQWFPGWSKPGTSSWGYHSDDGKIWCFADPPKIKDPGSARKYAYGDTAGCGIDVKKRTVFWTLNGQRLMEAGFQNVRGQIYPVVALRDVGKVKVNLGLNLKDEPFLWAPGVTCDFDSDVPAPTLRRSKSEH